MPSRDLHSILIVEDERLVARDLQQTLRELGYDPFAIASSADEAIQKAAERCPDLVLMDIRIKGARDGIDTAEILRTQFHVPVVYLTAHADEGTLDRAKKTEPLGYLLKPVKRAELSIAVEFALYKHAMETRLRERARWHATTLMAISDAVIAVDEGGRITFMNGAAEALTGTALNAAIGRPVREVVQLGDPTGGASATPVEQALRNGQAVAIEDAELLNLSSGQRRLVSSSAAPVIDDKARRPLGAVMVFRDVTELRDQQKRGERADRLMSLGTMAAGIAHEINNPLASVLGDATFVREEIEKLRLGPLSGMPELSSHLEEMTLALVESEAAAARIGRIVADLRAFSRPPPTSDACQADVVACVEEAIRATSHELRLRANLVTRLDAVPKVKADETKLGQVVVNLLMNAAHAISPGAAGRNEIRVETRTDSQGHVIIAVHDTGKGIPIDVRERIFEPFFTTKPSGEGTGLGLSICHGIVRSIGGEIRVNSRVGEGTSFEVVLPAVATGKAPAGVPETQPLPSTRGRILVVDDEPGILNLIKRTLREHEVVCVASAEQALAKIAEGGQFDLILSDVMMPTMTGIALYEELLRTDPAAARRVIFLSGGAVTAEVEEFLRTVPNCKIEKPFGLPALRETILRALS